MPFESTYQFFGRAIRRAFDEFYSDPFFRYMDASTWHYPLALEYKMTPAPVVVSPPLLRPRVRSSRPVIQPRGLFGVQRPTIKNFTDTSEMDIVHSDDVEVVEVIPVDSSDSEADEQSPASRRGRKRKSRRPVAVSHRHKRPRSEEPRVDTGLKSSSSAASGAAPTCDGDVAVPESKRPKTVSNKMEIDDTSASPFASLFGWKPRIVTKSSANDGSFVIEATLPGVDKENLSLDFSEEGGRKFLILTAEKSTLSKDSASADDKMAVDGEDAVAVSHHHFKFSRTIPLPPSIDKTGVRAEWLDGTLKISIANPTARPVAATTPVEVSDKTSSAESFRAAGDDAGNAQGTSAPHGSDSGNAATANRDSNSANNQEATVTAEQPAATSEL